MTSPIENDNGSGGYREGGGGSFPFRMRTVDGFLVIVPIQVTGSLPLNFLAVSTRRCILGDAVKRSS